MHSTGIKMIQLLVFVSLAMCRFEHSRADCNNRLISFISFLLLDIASFAKRKVSPYTRVALKEEY
jgi:hypothetical protein